MAGIGTMFYVALLVGMGVTKLWRWGLGLVQRIGKRPEASHAVRSAAGS